MVWGSSLPQSSVPPGVLVKTALSVGSKVKARGVVGHFTVDFLTFISPTTVSSYLQCSCMSCMLYRALAVADWMIECVCAFVCHSACMHNTCMLPRYNYDVTYDCRVTKSCGQWTWILA